MHLDHLPGSFFGPSNLVDLLRHRAHHQGQDRGFTFLLDGEDEEADGTGNVVPRQGTLQFPVRFDQSHEQHEDRECTDRHADLAAAEACQQILSARIPEPDRRQGSLLRP